MSDEAEQIHLIHEEDAALSATRSVNVPKPNFSTVAGVDPQIVDLLEAAAAASAAGQPDEILKDPKILKALLQTLQSVDVRQGGDASRNCALYICNLITDGCQRDTSNWGLVAEGVDGVNGTDAAFECFMKGWKHPETNDSLGFLVCSLISYYMGEKDVRPLFKMIIDARELPEMTSTGRIACISNLLRIDSVRADLANSGTLRSVVAQALQPSTNTVNVQEIYYAVICLWQLSFSDKVMNEGGPLHTHRTMIRSFLHMFSSNKKEKIIRASVKLLSNMIDREWCFEILVAQKVDYLLTSLTYENWRDPELNDEINSLLHKFYYQQNQMSNFERYVKELNSKTFLPGPLHTEKFWKQNVNRFEDNEYEAVKKLAAILNDNKDPTTLSLALFDIGEFARLYPTGKQIVTNIGAKARILDLMNSSNKEVAREALLTTQKLMLDNWKQLEH